LSAAGRIEEAKQALLEVSRHYPDLTISKVRQAMVLSDAALGRIAENLRRLGLPD
jgi:adenylate cyclase